MQLINSVYIHDLFALNARFKTSSQLLEKLDADFTTAPRHRNLTYSIPNLFEFAELRVPKEPGRRCCR